MKKLTLKERIIQYWDAGFPILFFNTFEELNALDILFDAAKGCNRQVLVWSYADGINLYVNGELKDKNVNRPATTPLKNVLALTLERMLDADQLEGKVLVFTDIHHYLEETEVITQLKKYVNKINEGADFTMVFLSPIIKIPRELEKFITIIETEYMAYNEIRQEVENFINEHNWPMIDDNLLNELAMAFKGLTKFEIHNLLALSYSDDSQLTRKDLKLIHDQKKADDYEIRYSGNDHRKRKY